MRQKWKRRDGFVFLLILCLLAAILTGCGSDGGQAGQDGNNGDTNDRILQIDGLTYEKSVTFDYARCLAIDQYEGAYSLVDVFDDAKFLVVPEGGSVPKELDDSIQIIQLPLQHIYLGATAVMSLFDAIDALDHVSMTALKESGWTVENAAKRMREGKLVYAGKYNTPDYELILAQGCELAIESTMIYHTPDVKEMLEELGVPVLVDRSSYESNPLGRTEWIKLYGVLTGKEEAANAFFEKQKESVAELENYSSTGKVAAFFYLTTDGKVVVRSSTDYVPSMIKMAGGVYAFDGVVDEDGKTSVSMTMESFYEKARDADYIIYNASIDSSVKTIEDLIKKDEVLKEFKAVKNGACYTTGSSMYQRTDVIANMILDFHKVFTGQDTDQLEFLEKMKESE